MDLALNNLQRLICHKPQETNRTLQVFWVWYCFSAMVSKLDWQTFSSEFQSDWVAHSYGFVPDRSKELRKLLLLLNKFLKRYNSCIDWPFEIITFQSQQVHRDLIILFKFRLDKIIDRV